MTFEDVYNSLEITEKDNCFAISEKTTILQSINTMKGKDIDFFLKKYNLPRTGKVDERRDRLKSYINK